MRTLPTSDESSTVLSIPAAWFMALGAAIGTASIYPLQPGVGEVAGSMGASVADIGVALGCGPVGYLLGLIFLVPLVDRHSPRRVLSAQFGALAIALAINAAAATPWLLGVVVAIVGAGSSVGAQLSSVAGRFADPRRRASVVGIVTAGISAGILAGRIVGGALTQTIGWRGTLLAFAAACVIIAFGALRLLPRADGRVTTRYLSAIREMPGLFVRYPLLRLAAGRGALWFFAFCAVWAGLAVALSQPPFSYSAQRIGMYAFAGLLGIVATRIAGSWTDRVGARPVILAGLIVAAIAATAASFFLSNTPVTLACLGLFDAGLFAAQVANQSSVLAIDPATPARFNSAYMLVYFVGGSIGTAFGAVAVGWWGWSATAAMSAGAIVLAIALTTSKRDARPGGREKRRRHYTPTPDHEKLSTKVLISRMIRLAASARRGSVRWVSRGD